MIDDLQSVEHEDWSACRLEEGVYDGATTAVAEVFVAQLRLQKPKSPLHRCPWTRFEPSYVDLFHESSRIKSFVGGIEYLPVQVHLHPVGPCDVDVEHPVHRTYSYGQTMMTIAPNYHF